MITHRKKTNDAVILEHQLFITQLTEHLVDFYFQQDEAVKPSLIAEDYGISWSIGAYEDAFDGLLEHDNGRFHIYVNEDRQQTLQRQRFTFCHELGHFFIDSHRNALLNGEVPYLSYYTGFASEQQIEREADFFSASLLMPRNRLLKDYRSYKKFGFHIVEQLSEKYGLSLIATIFRLLYLDVHPMMIVQSRRGRISYIFTSRDFYHYPKYKKERIPEDSVMFEYTSTGKKHRNTQQLWTGDWFRCRKEEKLYEHCLYYDPQEVCYSLVWKD